MARIVLPQDATIIDVESTLNNKEEYVRTVLETMVPCRREHGNAFVRIGITGEGKVPYHKLTYDEPDGTEKLYGSYQGMHPDKNNLIHENTWSSKRMTFLEVQEQLKRIRSIRGKA